MRSVFLFDWSTRSEFLYASMMLLSSRMRHDSRSIGEDRSISVGVDAKGDPSTLLEVDAEGGESTSLDVD